MIRSFSILCMLILSIACGSGSGTTSSVDSSKENAPDIVEYGNGVYRVYGGLNGQGPAISNFLKTHSSCRISAMTDKGANNGYLFVVCEREVRCDCAK
jgi:hypothetical protein